MRFAKPRPVEPVARAELFDGSPPEVEDLELQNQLYQLIQSSLDTDVSVRVKKRGREPKELGETSVVFRLLSTPHTISLLPPPPPPPVTREPECEDSEEMAETRRRQAKAVAVDAGWVMQESMRLPPPFRVGRVERVYAQPAVSGDTAPPMLLAHRLQSPRKTRPPVPRSLLQHYPYVVSAPVPPTAPTKGPIPSVELHEIPGKTRRRRRGKCKEWDVEGRALVL
ncbi:hypothetical protein B0H11DRAFT_2002579 [Mycena galericulata]|nr:hypothetical protein B0H11DRAFT_2002579 [Mycena galericulata]